MGLWQGVRRLFRGSGKESGGAELLAGVRQAYSAAASDPGQPQPFPVGRSFAEEVGYPAALLDSLPKESSDSFAGVGSVGAFAEIAPGARVLDLGCGAGLDALIAARKSGPAGWVVGLDFSLAMLAKAAVASRRAGIATLLYCAGEAGRLPIASGSIDVVLVNGIFNLNPERGQLFQELARVLRLGGAVYAAELIFTRPRASRRVREINEWLS